MCFAFLRSVSGSCHFCFICAVFSPFLLPLCLSTSYHLPPSHLPLSQRYIIRLYILFSPLSPPFIHFIPSTLFPYQVFQSSPPPLALSPTSFPPRTCILTRYKPSVLFPRGDAPGDYITCKNVYVYVDARYHCCPFFLTSRK